MVWHGCNLAESPSQKNRPLQTTFTCIWMKRLMRDLAAKSPKWRSLSSSSADKASCSFPWQLWFLSPFWGFLHERLPSVSPNPRRKHKLKGDQNPVATQRKSPIGMEPVSLVYVWMYALHIYPTTSWPFPNRPSYLFTCGKADRSTRSKFQSLRYVDVFRFFNMFTDNCMI